MASISVPLLNRGSSTAAVRNRAYPCRSIWCAGMPRMIPRALAGSSRSVPDMAGRAVQPDAAALWLVPIGRPSRRALADEAEPLVPSPRALRQLVLEHDRQHAPEPYGTPTVFSVPIDPYLK